MTLHGFKAISADIESKRVLKLHFDHEVTDADREALVAAINAYIANDQADVAQEKINER